VLGAIDSLLTSLVADNMTRTRHDSDKELIGQGIGNTFAGFFGAIPGAGATMRTVVNIRTGGETKISGMIHAGLLLLIVVSLSPLVSQIPHAVLVGILTCYFSYAHNFCHVDAQFTQDFLAPSHHWKISITAQHSCYIQ
jgi:SulP family sulfate permease